jgi:hypothetical protein
MKRCSVLVRTRSDAIKSKQDTPSSDKSRFSNTGSTTAILAACLFGCMVAHQCYYNQEANKVASVEGESEDIEEVA